MKDSPSIVVRRGCDSTTSEDGLTLQKHLLPRRENAAIGDHQILNNVGVGDNDK